MILKGKAAYFPVESLVGLGHFNRTGKIVREMVETGMDVTVASGTFVDPARFFSGARVKKLPQYVFFSKSSGAHTISDNGQYKIVDRFNEKAWAESRIRSHVKHVTSCAPDLVISEFWPFDRHSLDEEMSTLLEHAQKLNPNMLKFVSVRDVLDDQRSSDNSVTSSDAINNRAMWTARTINERFNAVLVHGDPAFVPLSETFAASDNLTTNVIYTGYVIDDLPPRVVPDRQNGSLLVSCGSGVDGHEMVYSFLSAWSRLLQRREAGDPESGFVTTRPVRIVCGPRFYPRAYRHVQDWATQLSGRHDVDITVESYRPDFTSVLSRAAFSVSFAGYNTTLETLALRVPSLLIPKYATQEDGDLRYSTEQLYRLKRLQKFGVCAHALPSEVQNSDEFSRRLLQEVLLQTASDRQHKSPGLNFSGAANSINAISNLMREQQNYKKRVFAFLSL